VATRADLVVAERPLHPDDDPTFLRDISKKMRKKDDEDDKK
jgi:hypothetical protein